MQLLDDLEDETMHDVQDLVSFFEGNDNVALEVTGAGGTMENTTSGEDFLKSLWAEDEEEYTTTQFSKSNCANTNNETNLLDITPTNQGIATTSCLGRVKVKEEFNVLVKLEGNSNCLTSTTTTTTSSTISSSTKTTTKSNHKEGLGDHQSECSPLRNNNSRGAARAARRLAVKERRAKRKSSLISNHSSNGKAENEDHVNTTTSLDCDDDKEMGEDCDINSKDAKKQRRLIRNRMSAQLHRERKKAYVDQLEAKLHDKDICIAKLMDEVSRLKKENLQLRQNVQTPSSPMKIMTDLKEESNILSSELPNRHSLPTYPPSSPDDATDCEGDGTSSSRSSPKNHCVESERDLYGAFRKKSVAMMMTMVISVAYFGNTLYLISNAAKGLSFSVKLNTPESDSLEASDISSKISATARILSPLEVSHWEDMNFTDLWGVVIEVSPDREPHFKVKDSYPTTTKKSSEAQYSVPLSESDKVDWANVSEDSTHRVVKDIAIEIMNQLSLNQKSYSYVSSNAMDDGISKKDSEKISLNILVHVDHAPDFPKVHSSERSHGVVKSSDDSRKLHVI